MKGKRTNLADANCGIARSLDVIGDWWSLLIIREAFQGKERFGEFQKSLGLAKNILSTLLKKLVADGVFETRPDGDTGSVHRYVLTTKGEELCVVMVALWQWGEQSCFERGALRYAMVDRQTGKPLEKLELKARDGRRLGPHDFLVKKK